MSQTFFRVLSVFRPDDPDLSQEKRAQIQIHRVLSLVGVLLVPLFGPLYAIYNPEAIDPDWARFGIATLFFGLFVASYGVRAIRHHFVFWIRGMLYILTIWFTVLTTLNDFAGNYAIGLLLVYAVLAVVVGLGVPSIGPALRFLVFGLLLAVGGGLAVPAPQTSLPILLLCMATVALVGSIVIQTQLSILQELREAKEEAEEASRLKSAMLANMSHEIRTPLTSVNGYAEILAGELEGRLQTFAQKIYESGQLLLSTLDSFLVLSRLEAGMYPVDREPMRLEKQVARVVRAFQPQAEKKSIDLTTDTEPPVDGRFDEDAVTRIAEYLIDNAIKFTPEGGRVDVRVYEDDATAVLEVEDTGIGIAEAAVPEIFEMFKQESEGLDREYEGIGIGLSVTYRLVEALGGQIEVESEKETGSRFTVRLPRSTEEAGNGQVYSGGLRPRRSIVYEPVGNNPE